MKKVRVMPGAFLMIFATVMFDRAEIFFLYYLSAALHELGHITAARLMDIEITEIRFDYSGVRICTQKGIISYKNELMLAFAGPLANLAVICISISAMAVMGIGINGTAMLCNDLLVNQSYTLGGALGFIALASFLQGSVNLLPVRTFDGGRMLYCILAPIFSEKVAEKVLGIFSLFSAFAVWTAAIYLMLRVSSGLGIYVFSACLFFANVKKE